MFLYFFARNVNCTVQKLSHVYEDVFSLSFILFTFSVLF